MKFKTTELTGTALDWAVVKADGVENMEYVWPRLNNYSPSSNWGQGGPIIQKNLIVTSPDPMHNWLARSYMDATEFYGDTPLIAAMRCFVASQLGDEVEVPDDLAKTEA